MKRRISISSLMVLVIFLLCNGFASGEKPQKVVIVHSYEKDHVCGQPQEDGAIRAIRKSGLKIGEDFEIHSFFMDTKKTYTKPSEIQERGRLALEQVRKIDPVVVITIDDNAAETVMLPLVGSDIQVVFCGMNGQPEDYDKKRHFMECLEKPGGNVTGVYEKLQLVTSLGVIKGILPDLRKVLGITDYSPTGNAITKQFEKEIKEQAPPVAFEIVRVRDFDEYKKVIHSANKDREIGAIYPVALLLNTSDGKTYTAPDIFRWTIRNCRKPEIPLNYFFSKLGLFGGAAVDFEAMGYQAGSKAAEILKGSRAGDLPIEDAYNYAIVFNLARAKELGINIPFEILGASDFVYEKLLL
jgi:ABC-type uncharacterized transport system substrate-binding protein